MRKAERLFQLLNLLRGRRTVLTAQQLAEVLEVSERTIYRDIQALSLSGVPVEGEAGVGYRLPHQFDLPPIMFDHDEVEALLLGARMVRSWGDRQLAASASSALNKILGILPPALKDIEISSPIKVPNFQKQSAISDASESLRKAIKLGSIVAIKYIDAKEKNSSRKIVPLGIFFWGKAWTLVAWCEKRKDYRTFRIDRIVGHKITEKKFTTTANCSLEHYLAQERIRFNNYTQKAESC